jgi:hypothetical protein
MRLPALAACLVALAASSAAAQPVYRCGSTYSQQACPGAIAMVAPASRSEADAARARSQAQSDAKLADQLEKQRLAQEARAPKATVLGGQPSPPPKQEAAPIRKLQKGEKQPHFIAVGPRPVKEKKQAKKKSS